MVASSVCICTQRWLRCRWRLLRGESTQSVGISFLKSYVGVCLEGAVIVLACVIYSAFVGTPTVTGSEATTIVWSYLAETVFNMLVLVGLIKGSDRIIHEMMGL